MFCVNGCEPKICPSASFPRLQRSIPGANQRAQRGSGVNKRLRGVTGANKRLRGVQGQGRNSGEYRGK